MKTLSDRTCVLIGAAVLLYACIITAPASASGAGGPVWIRFPSLDKAFRELLNEFKPREPAAAISLVQSWRSVSYNLSASSFETHIVSEGSGL